MEPAICWAALDCPSFFGALAFHELGPPLLGRISARIDALPRIGEHYVSVGWLRSIDGRKISTAAALFTADGALIAVSTSLWILLK